MGKLNLLNQLPKRIRDAVIKRARTRLLVAGEQLFAAGDDGQSVFFVVTGSLGVYVPARGDLAQRLVALIGAGETVGEMALISQAPRSATIIAIRDSELLELDQVAFDELIDKHPRLTAGLNRLLVERLRRTSMEPNPVVDARITAILPGSRSVDPGAIARRLRHELEQMGDTVYVAGPEELGKPGSWLSSYEDVFNHVLVWARADKTQWVERCARQADRIIIAVDERDRPPLCLSADALRQRGAHQLLDLAIVHAGNRCIGEAGQWLKCASFARHFHLRDSLDGDWRRLARIIAGRGIALVLSGGGARAYAHLGVMQALREKGIVADFFGGSSMGAIVAACFAMDWPLEAIVERIKECFVRSNPLSDYSLPLIALTRGRKVDRLLISNFADQRIEDMPLPFFCVSTNLTSADLTVHASDNLVKALRASISLPGILPPVLDRGSVLVDGGVMDNLPVEVMRARAMGPIIASNVTRDLSISAQWLNTEMAKPLYKRMLHPPIIGLLMRSGTVTAESHYRSQIEQADLLIEPPLGQVDIHEWASFDETYAIGYRHTVKMLETHNLAAMLTAPPVSA